MPKEILWDTSYLNLTANKGYRFAPVPDGVFGPFGGAVKKFVWHETASPSPLNPYGTLNYNLAKSVGASYTALIDRVYGRIFAYVDERIYTAFHAGAYSLLNGWNDGQVNIWTVGIEFDGPADGTPITPPQWDAAIALIHYYNALYGVRIDRIDHFSHKEVTTEKPGYRSDPRGVGVDDLIARAKEYRAWTKGIPGGLFRVRGLANIRQGPGRNYAIANNGQAVISDGSEIRIDHLVHGEKLGYYDLWGHLENGLGFVHESLLQRMTLLMPEKRLQLNIFVEPRIQRGAFHYLLRRAGSTAANTSEQLHSICVEEGVDPAVALAFFAHESNYGKLGITAQYNTFNWGNVRTPYQADLSTGVVQTEKGEFATYASWELALRDWCRRLKGRYLVEKGLSTVEAVIPVYAPSSDGNSIQAYIDHITTLVREWEVMNQEPGHIWVDPAFEKAWIASGDGQVKPDILTPGNPIRHSMLWKSAWTQAFEKSVATDNKGIVEWLNLQQIRTFMDDLSII